METKHKKQLQKRMEKENKTWKAIVVNRASGNNMGFEVITRYNSKDNTFEELLHKIELDLMTNLHYGYKNPIQVYISESGN